LIAYRYGHTIQHGLPGDLLAKFDAAGQPDPAFTGSRTFIGLQLGTPPRGLLVSDLAYDSAGRILMAGSAVRFVGYDDALYSPATARLMPQGSLDHSYGDEGAAIFPRLGGIGLTDLVPLGDDRFAAAGGAGLGRFLLTDAPRNADLDRLHDRKDRCAYIFSRRPSGCPRLIFSFAHLRYVRSKGSIMGELTGTRRCLGRKVTLFRKRRGSTLRIGSMKPERHHVSEHVFSFDVSRPGRYVLRTKAQAISGLGECAAMRERLRVRG
jgi:hypothetical protein